ncbi:MAG: tryptophan 2,3-dioxygenase [Alphaproteobacteria bacterium]|nr:MAG: tryptophan 2,3-dioxygenase [Alphaproteobacteria bacterium]
MSDSVTYGGYLRLNELLAAQQPQTEQHDELLFVILHQTMELWMKQAIHEIGAAQSEIRAGDLSPAYKHMARVSRIQAVMTQTWDILATMTPADYLRFRSLLGSSSGFQSAQFRVLEYKLGMKDAAFLRHHSEGSADRKALETALAEPSLYEDAIEQLAKAGFDVPESAYRGGARAYVASAAVEDAWLEVYRDTEKYWQLYQLAEKLIDLDDAMLTWRHKHVLTVERIIGGKRGTGGTEGVGYLQKTLARRAFPELWMLRTRL